MARIEILIPVLSSAREPVFEGKVIDVWEGWSINSLRAHNVGTLTTELSRRRGTNRRETLSFYDPRSGQRVPIFIAGQVLDDRTALFAKYELYNGDAYRYVETQVSGEFITPIFENNGQLYSSRRENTSTWPATHLFFPNVITFQELFARYATEPEDDFAQIFTFYPPEPLEEL
ncbi:MAG: hypothetical protein QY318_00090 [Candidatus Dojkabacteria bacterium]|nr:MAG: hypothetical protein QY318_00090 [Candidatus Dojkabacteria bacterium]